MTGTDIAYGTTRRHGQLQARLEHSLTRITVTHRYSGTKETVSHIVFQAMTQPIPAQEYSPSASAYALVLGYTVS
eukprot:1860148-Rhodomonas_salina.1